MKQTLWGLLALFLLALVPAVVLIRSAERVVSRLGAVYRIVKTTAAKWLCVLMISALSLASRLRAPVLRGLTFTRLKAFRERLALRQRPHVTPTWRMCPST